MDPRSEGRGAVAVLGSGRSGTSTVTRLLRALGYDLGPEACMMRPTASNPKGYFELVPVVRFHNELLARLGGGCFDPPELPRGWAVDARLAPVRARLRALVEGLFEGREEWVVKDPRLSFLLPLWRETFPGLSCIVALRNPVDVAASLGRSDGLPFPAAVAYWERAVRSALSATAGARRLLLFYEDLMEDGEALFRAIAAFCGKEALAALPEVRRQAAAFLEPRLHRHRTAPEAVLEHPGLPFTARALYLSLRLAVPGGRDPAERWPLLDRFAACFPHQGGSPAAAGLSPAARAEAGPPAARPGTPHLSVVIPLYNALHHTRRCVEALFRHTPDDTPFEVILVDNGSTDGTGAYLRALERTRTGVRILSLGRNRGFARACNEGARAARGDFLLFLNSDAEVTPGWLPPLRRALEEDPRVCAAGPRLLYPDGTIECAGVVFVEDRVLGDPLAARPLFRGRPGDTAEALEPRAFRALTAACLLVRRKAFEEAEGFDEGYWNGYEDVDLCLRLGRRGGKLLYVPASTVIHHEARSGGERFRKVKENVARFHARWLGRIRPDFVLEGSETGGSGPARPPRPAVGPGIRGTPTPAASSR